MQIDTHLLPPRATEEGTSNLQGRVQRNLWMHAPGEEQWNRTDLFSDDDMVIIFFLQQQGKLFRDGHILKWLGSINTFFATKILPI